MLWWCHMMNLTCLKDHRSLLPEYIEFYGGWQKVTICIKLHTLIINFYYHMAEDLHNSPDFTLMTTKWLILWLCPTWKGVLWRWLVPLAIFPPSSERNLVGGKALGHRYTVPIFSIQLALFPGYSQIFSHSCGARLRDSLWVTWERG